jgi:phenylalanyl-tRNA synthetase beta chain
MRAPLSWLRDYAPLDAPTERIVEALSGLGLVVESVETVGAGIADVVVAKVLDIRKHPDADRIRIVDVDAGDGNALQIICGAWNFDVGDLVPLAPVGAVLPGDFKISRRKMRGEVSNGMLCSPAELDLADPAGSDGLLVLPEGSAEAGTPLAEALGVHPDVVFDIDVTPNRPDALCMAGVARDLAAALGEEWAWPSAPPVGTPDPTVAVASLRVDAGEMCPRFAATVLEDVPSASSPLWMSRRLTLAGMRPISGIVDVSNYVMLDVGQPNHAYDLDRLGGGGLSVRRGREGETVRTLDGVLRHVGPQDCVICDAEGTAVGIGGVMGAASAEIDDTTRRVLLECAYFDPATIARTGKRLGLGSEARTRFERGVDPELAGRALERFVELLRTLEWGDKVRFGVTAEYRDATHTPVAPVVALRTRRVNSLLGTSLADDDVAGLLRPLGFSVEASPDGSAAVTVPTWRLECSREVDLVEEVARMLGYGRIARTLPPSRKRTGAARSAVADQRRRLRGVLVGAGFDEAWTTTFIAPGDLAAVGLGPDAVEVDNPLDSGESILRPTLLPGLLRALRYNTDRQCDDLALFEIGRVFRLPSGESVLPVEEERLGVAVVLPRSTGRDAAVESAVRTWVLIADALRLYDPVLAGESAAGLHPGRAARVGAGDVNLGVVGEVAGEVSAAYGLAGRVGWLDISLDALAGAARRDRRAQEVSRFPAADIDLAFVVADNVAASTVAAALRLDGAQGAGGSSGAGSSGAGSSGGASLPGRPAGGNLVEGVTLIDVYHSAELGDAKRGLTFRVRLRAADRTLDDSEISQLRTSMIEAVARLGAPLRS